MKKIIGGICLVVAFSLLCVGLYVVFLIKNEDKRVLMEWEQLSVGDFHEDKYRNNIVTAFFIQADKVPDNAVAHWDVSMKKDNSVFAYVLQNQLDSSKYDLYIGSDRKVIASKSLSHIFHNFPALTSVNMSALDASNVEIMWRSFSSSPNLKSVALPSNTPNLKNINAIFSGCKSLTGVNMSSMNLENIEDMGYAFSGCASLTGVDFGTFTAKNVKEMSYAFSGCNHLANLNLGLFNPDSLENASYMFNWSNRLKTLDISQLDVSKIVNSNNMFYKMPVDAVVYVKDQTVKNWILSLPLTSRPPWVDSNILIK